MKASNAAVKLIKQFEGLRLHSYEDGSGWSVGYGQSGQHIGPGLKITEFEAEQMLKNHIAGLQEEMSELITSKITQNQFDALVSLVYNIGINAFKRSTLLKRLNEDRHSEAGLELLRWNHIRGVESEGLTNRRREEYRLFTG